MFNAICIVLVGLCSFAQGTYDESGEYVFQEYLRWNYTYMNPSCTSPSGRNPCMDIRICNFAVASLALGGWPTLCGWVGKGVPKVCCGLPLVLGPTLMKKVDEEIARKMPCGTTIVGENLSETKNKFFEIANNIKSVNISDLTKYDPPLDLISPTIISALSYIGSQQGDFPWMVSVRKDGSHICGGSLIDRKHVLTAAHCVNGRLDQYTVAVGNLYADEGYSINITQIRIQPGYDEKLRYNALALLFLTQEILKPEIPPICLAPGYIQQDEMIGENPTLLQWETVANDTNNYLLLHVLKDSTVLQFKECYWVYKKAGFMISKELGNDVICTKRVRTDKDKGEGYGGPLMYKLKSDDQKTSYSNIPWTLIGVDTFEPVREASIEYHFYTRVSADMTWIKEQLREN